MTPDVRHLAPINIFTSSLDHRGLMSAQLCSLPNYITSMHLERSHNVSSSDLSITAVTNARHQVDSSPAIRFGQSTRRVEGVRRKGKRNEMAMVHVRIFTWCQSQQKDGAPNTNTHTLQIFHLLFTSALFIDLKLKSVAAQTQRNSLN